MTKIDQYTMAVAVMSILFIFDLVTTHIDIWAERTE